MFIILAGHSQTTTGQEAWRDRTGNRSNNHGPHGTSRKRIFSFRLLLPCRSVPSVVKSRTACCCKRQEYEIDVRHHGAAFSDNDRPGNRYNNHGPHGTSRKRILSFRFLLPCRSVPSVVKIRSACCRKRQEYEIHVQNLDAAFSDNDRTGGLARSEQEIGRTTTDHTELHGRGSSVSGFCFRVVRCLRWLRSDPPAAANDNDLSVCPYDVDITRRTGGTGGIRNTCS